MSTSTEDKYNQLSGIIHRLCTDRGAGTSTTDLVKSILHSLGTTARLVQNYIDFSVMADPLAVALGSPAGKVAIGSVQRIPLPDPDLNEYPWTEEGVNYAFTWLLKGAETRVVGNLEYVDVPQDAPTPQIYRHLPGRDLVLTVTGDLPSKVIGLGVYRRLPGESFSLRIGTLYAVGSGVSEFTDSLQVVPWWALPRADWVTTVDHVTLKPVLQEAINHVEAALSILECDRSPKVGVDRYEWSDEMLDAVSMLDEYMNGY